MVYLFCFFSKDNIKQSKTFLKGTSMHLVAAGSAARFIFDCARATSAQIFSVALNRPRLLSADSFTMAAFNKLYTFPRAISMSRATWQFQFARQDATPTNLRLRDGRENNAKNRRFSVRLGDVRRLQNTKDFLLINASRSVLSSLLSISLSFSQFHSLSRMGKNAFGGDNLDTISGAC